MLNSKHRLLDVTTPLGRNKDMFWSSEDLNLGYFLDLEIRISNL